MNRHYFPAEYVFPAHPDKVCAAIADSLVEEGARRSPRAHAAIEVAVHMNSVYITGRLACTGAQDVDVAALARSVYASAGYGEAWRPRPEDLDVVVNLCRDELGEEEAGLRAYADDQAIVTGYAEDSPGTNYLPFEHWIASRLSQRFARLHETHPDLLLGPDGKLLIICGEEDGSRCVERFTVCLQQREAGSELELCRAVRDLLQECLAEYAGVIDGLVPRLPEEIRINGFGLFETGGTEGDNGLSGKKLVVDAYGPRVPIGGGALSGKDFFKPDRAGALLARRLAKAVVMTGAARACTTKLAIFPGDEAFCIVSMTADDIRGGSHEVREAHGLVAVAAMTRPTPSSSTSIISL
jgi:S-adenosylmethionine synthetase